MLHIISDQCEIIAQSYGSYRRIRQRQRLAFLTVVSLEESGESGHLPVDLEILKAL